MTLISAKYLDLYNAVSTVLQEVLIIAAVLWLIFYIAKKSTDSGKNK